MAFESAISSIMVILHLNTIGNRYTERASSLHAYDTDLRYTFEHLNLASKYAPSLFCFHCAFLLYKNGVVLPYKWVFYEVFGGSFNPGVQLWVIFGGISMMICGPSEEIPSTPLKVCSREGLVAVTKVIVRLTFCYLSIAHILENNGTPVRISLVCILSVSSLLFFKCL